MAVTRDSFTEGRLRQRLGADPPRRQPDGFDLPGANLARLGLSKARLDGSDLHGANLRGADLQQATLAGANLAGADLGEALLQGADLTRADLSNANLSRAVLDGTVVAGAIFTGTCLSGAVCRNVALWQAGLTPQQMVDCSVALAGLLESEPEPTQVPDLLAWTAALGTDAERWALRHCLAERRWRPWRRALSEALGALDARLGPLSKASLSPAQPGSAADERSLSQAANPQRDAGGRSLSWLRDWRKQRHDDEP